ncbi:aminoglycoside phosphotransferase family protein [Frigidibacter sp. ROC022]|uniref:aminoglycoside phosphotransferase family protein n=1 Tax=Frigidibacter sp. ROC022 TaxID=2971796 RepID=UPI00215B1A07|nr:phosphotransferase [Frigidibacter sp. ROC022]MCR8724491.1 phosphotransferase [Frigidibacter sp. ROC022]
MTDRAALIDAFLAAGDWRRARREKLAGDASNRRYERLLDGPGGVTTVLMDAAPERGEDVRPFIAMAEHLVGLGYSAPRILDRDVEAGLLILEDLGDDLFARVLRREPGREVELFGPAVDLIGDLMQAPLPGFIEPYGPELVPLAQLSFDWYLRGATGDPAPAARAEFGDLFSAALARMAPRSVTVILRDYHAENLIWLPQRQGLARVGLLDFQDARSGHPVYDLVSLLEDVRRDVSPEVDARMRQHFIRRTGLAEDEVGLAAALCATQRNLRILGVFSRLSLHYGKPQYIDLIPRLWRHLQSDLDHPALAEVAALLRRVLPEPTPEILNRLKAQCGTVPQP